MRALSGAIAVLAIAALSAAWHFSRVDDAIAPVATSTVPAAIPRSPAADERVVLPAAAGDLPAPDGVDSTVTATHPAREGGRCLAGTSAAAPRGRMAVHRWVDARGILHFSDAPPAAGARDHRVIEVDGVPAVEVRARGHDVNLPDRLVQRVVADAQAVERAMRSAFGIDAGSGLVLDIVFIRSAQAYSRHVSSPAMAGSAGAYSPRERTIFVRWQDDEDIVFRILRHELTHALVHEHVGLLPVVMNEGLAGFFERLVVSGLGAQVAVGGDPDRDAAAARGGDGIDALVDLLAHDGASFYGSGRETHYERAYVLVTTLMAHPQGRAAIGAVLAAQRADSCAGVDVAELLDAHYPGGLARLAADFSRQLRDAPATVHAF